MRDEPRQLLAEPSRLELMLERHARHAAMVAAALMVACCVAIVVRHVVLAVAG